jgi:hypothetical protein
MYKKKRNMQVLFNLFKYKQKLYFFCLTLFKRWRVRARQCAIMRDDFSVLKVLRKKTKFSIFFRQMCCQSIQIKFYTRYFQLIPVRCFDMCMFSSIGYNTNKDETSMNHFKYENSSCKFHPTY